MPFLQYLNQFTRINMIFVWLQYSHIGFRPLAMYIRMQIQISRTISSFLLTAAQVKYFLAVMTSHTSTIQYGLYFQIECKRTDSAFGCLDCMRRTLGSECTFGNRNLILVFVAPDTRDYFARLTCQPTTHKLYRSSVFVNWLD